MTSINHDRKWVIMCNGTPKSWDTCLEPRANEVVPGCLLFLGSLTRDDEKRSFNGFTPNIDRCERYTADEVVKVWNRLHVRFWTPRESHNYEDIRKHKYIAIEPENLPLLGLSPMQVWYKP